MCTPEWTVMAVFDPDGGGEDFAYTVGLAAKGSPELHVWRRPTDGLDPGDDFVLSPTDAQHLLNRCARQVLNGDLRPGSEFDVEYDCGLTIGRFRVGEPVDPDAVDAFQVDHDATVLPLRWSIERPVPTAARDVPPEVWHDVTALGARVLGEPLAVIDSLTATAALVRSEISSELGAQYAIARRDGRLEAFNRCEVLGSQHAAQLLPASRALFAIEDDAERAHLDESVMELASMVLRAAYTWFVVGDLPGDGALFSSKRLVAACVAPRGEQRRYWAHPGAGAVRRRAAELSENQLLQLGEEVERLGERHYRQHWWAAARSAGLGRGWPAGSASDLVDLVPSLGGRNWDELVAVGQAISGAALAVTLPSEAAPAIDVLGKPWRRVV